MTLGQRFVSSGLWAACASLVGTLILALRSIVLARLLSVEAFGVYAFAATIVGLTAGIARFGLGQALVHRADETVNEARAAAVHFTLTLIFSTGWAITLILLALGYFEGPQQVALIVLTLGQYGLQLVATPIALLRRQVHHQLLATLRIVNALTASAVALGLAWSGQGLWALLMIDVVTSILSVAILLTQGPAWHPRLRWDRSAIGYFLRFGGRSMTGRVLEDALNRVDKLWVGVVLSEQALGLYARSTAYSRAPIDLVARPLDSITTGVYAELKGDRGRLTRAVSRITALLVYGAGLLAAVVGLLAPELIQLLIGAKWLPMLEPFRILLVASVPAAINRNFGHLLVAAGVPGAGVKIAALRLIVLIGGIATLGAAYGLTGVAISVLAASLVGFTLFIRRSEAFVDLQHWKLFGPVVPAAAAALVVGGLVGQLRFADASLWIRVMVEGVGASLAYVLLLLAFQGRELRDDLEFLIRNWKRARGR